MSCEALQLDFDDPIGARSRKTDPASSVAAARRVDADGQRARILAVLRHAARPLYAAEIAAKTNIPTGQVNSRLAVMAKRGMVLRLSEPGRNDFGDPVLLWEPVL